MLYKYLLAVLLLAAGVFLAASAIPQWTPIFAPSFATVGSGANAPRPDNQTMYLASLGVMGLIARRRSR